MEMWQEGETERAEGHPPPSSCLLAAAGRRCAFGFVLYEKIDVLASFVF
jgi:hypothetical protein